MLRKVFSKLQTKVQNQINPMTLLYAGLVPALWQKNEIVIYKKNEIIPYLHKNNNKN